MESATSDDTKWNSSRSATVFGREQVVLHRSKSSFLGTPAPETTQGLPIPPITQSHAAVSRGNSATCVSQQVSERRSGTSSEECLAEFDDKLPWKEDAEPQEAEVKEAASPGAATQATTRSAHFELPEVVAVANKEPPKFSEVAGDEDKELASLLHFSKSFLRWERADVKELFSFYVNEAIHGQCPQSSVFNSLPFSLWV
ncbi:unnamed protein product [Dibothriocephalus latus]|uniref:Uncharacterized protein n=1 Tax=Dibothriocephalus latus TaxID=60516 RepID=A0A3P7L9S3_DIBLA|nr:unnamed protein product [Dibothriocephalus latus]